MEERGSRETLCNNVLNWMVTTMSERRQDVEGAEDNVPVDRRL